MSKIITYIILILLRIIQMDDIINNSNKVFNQQVSKNPRQSNKTV